MTKPLIRVLVVAGTAALLLSGWVVWECRDLPTESALRVELLARYDARTRSGRVPLSAISTKLQAAVLAKEDTGFYFHHGLAYEEIKSALLRDLRSGKYVRGASTITQQLARTLFLSPEKTLRRKLREAVLARRVERVFGKNEILEMYLNTADWGDGVVGAQAAALFYFARPAAELDWAEAAMLAAMLANPHRFDPRTDAEQLRRLRQAVLKQLRENGDIGEEDFRGALAEPLLSLLAVPGAAQHGRSIMSAAAFAGPNLGVS